MNDEYPNADAFEDPADDTPSAHVENDDKNIEKALKPILLKVESEKYVISLNDRPLFFVPNEAIAHIKMWATARLLIKDRQDRDPNFQHFIKTTDNELIVTCLARVLYYVAYDSVAFRLRYDKVRECK